MLTVNEVSKLTGVTIRMLRYYDKIGLLRPTAHTESGYRLYDEEALERLQQILLFRELEFPLKEIKGIISNPDFDRETALEQQIELLSMRKERLEQLIAYARELQVEGVKKMDFSVFDTSKIDAYAERAKRQWGGTAEYKESEKKMAKRTADEQKQTIDDFMKLFAEFGAMKNGNPDSEEAKVQVKKLQAYITEHFYHCTDEILFNLGQMYVEDEEFTKNIDQAGGEGTAAFVSEAISIYCGK